MRYQSNALWPADVYTSMYGDHISTDTHDTIEQARGVCAGLERHGFGGNRQHFPLRTWVSAVQQPPKLPAQEGEKP